MRNREEYEILRRIQEAGYLREFDLAKQLNFPQLEIENDPYQSFAFDFLGGTGFILDLRITTDRKVQIQEFGDVEMAGRACSVNWWVTQNLYFYKFPGGPEYPLDVVLNHRVGVRLKPGKPLEGILLGCSSAKIPDIYSHGFTCPLEFSITDGFDNMHFAQLLVTVDEHLCSKSRRPSRGSLYAPRLNKKRDLANGAEPIGPRRVEADMHVLNVKDAAPGRVGHR